MTKEKILTPDEYVQLQIVMYPTLFAGFNTTYEESKMKVFDQMLNVVGNGIRDNDELIEAVTKVPTTRYSEKYLKEKLFSGYTEVDEIPLGDGEKVIVRPKGSYYCICLESEKEKFPMIKYWLEGRPHAFDPYPNFKEQYSVIYQAPKFLELGKEWIEAAIWFYESCREYFEKEEKTDQIKEYIVFIGKTIAMLRQHL